MKNKEFFSKEIIEIAKLGSVAVYKDKPIPCEIINCYSCKFVGQDCHKARKEWFESEYIPPKIDLPEDIEVNTPILVKDYRDSWVKRHFAAFSENRDKVYVYADGRSAWTNEEHDIVAWEYAKLP